ncbi:MAG: alpha/beta fold hydrolase [Actinomycetia bacterium]|nr:alpha/beta fold hydrolase [Actinomycetes bacterium]
MCSWSHKSMSIVAALALVAVSIWVSEPVRATVAGPDGATVVDVALDPDGVGSWTADDFGRVYATGAAEYGGLHWSHLFPGERTVAIEAVASGEGYLLFTSMGRVAVFGDAIHSGDLTGSAPPTPVVDAALTPTGNGYVMTTAEGAVYTFGDATHRGAGSDHQIHHPITAVVANSDGYWLFDQSGGVWAFGTTFLGGANDGGSRNIVDAAATPTGYTLLDADGTVHSFSSSTHASIPRTRAGSPSLALDIDADGDRVIVLDADGTSWLAAGGTSPDSSTGTTLSQISTRPVPMAISPVGPVATTGYRSRSGSDPAAWNALVPQAQDVRIQSSADGSLQPAMWLPAPAEDRPLLVVLHSWSSAYHQQWSIPYGEWASDNGWAMIAPNFRGVNKTPAATGSDLAVADVVDSIEYAVERGADPARVFIVGFSGGGHMALLMAGRHPELFAGVASWVPVYDLPDWYVYNEVHAPWRHYVSHIQGSCGGAPRPGTAAYENCVHRSPMTHLDAARAAGVPVYIAGGLRDSLVPPSHAARAFNQLADPADRFTSRQVNHFDHLVMPPELIGETDAPSYFGPEDREVVISRSSGPVTFVLFNGSHEMFFEPALRWFAVGPGSGGFTPQSSRNVCRADSTPAHSPAPSSTEGYWVLDSSGAVHGFGLAVHGDLSDSDRTAVSMEATATGNGYWIVDDLGGVHAFGDAQFHGDMTDLDLAEPIIRLVANPRGTGYWLQAEDGGVFTFGDAQFHGSTGALDLAAPIVSMEVTTTGNGYWLLGLDGGVFTFGDAGYHGSTGAMIVNSPVTSMAVNADGSGYWLHGGDGGVFAFGSVGFHGSLPGTGRCETGTPVQFVPTASGNGYWVATSDGEVFAFGDAVDRGGVAFQPGVRVLDMAAAH